MIKENADLNILVHEGFLFIYKCEIFVNYTIAMHTFFPGIHRERNFPSGNSLAKSIELDNVAYF